MKVAIGMTVGVLAAAGAARWERAHGRLARACVGLVVDMLMGRPYLFLRRPHTIVIRDSLFEGMYAGNIEHMWLENNDLPPSIRIGDA